MAIPVKDIKILWGKAGGRCSKPDAALTAFSSPMVMEPL
ncbi:hypothetical protein JCM19238_3664 [Vibrio ponticus]|nr:hypothetical protein JCM19238_3664 [Vibrio ponticus]